MSKLRLRSLLNEVKTRLNEDDAELAANLMKAYKAGPAATRAYLDSPEGSSEELRALLLKPQPEVDGDAGDDLVKVGNASGPASGFKPTQNEIDLMKSVSYPLGSAKTLINAIQNPTATGIVTSGDLIIDGHHRWSGAIAIGGDAAQIQGQSVEWPGKNTAEMLAAAQIAIAAKLGPGKSIPSQGEGFKTNILGADAGKISGMIMSNINKQTDKGAPGPMLNDKMIKDLVGKEVSGWEKVYEWLGIDPFAEDVKNKGYKLRLAIANKIGENLATLPNNPEAPERKDMPQFDKKVGGPPLDTVTADLKGGKFNVSPPFAKQESRVKSGNRLNESIDKSRWAILANIKK